MELKTAIYLRKSRADEEKERYFGQGETLAIHRKELLSFAKIKKLNIVKVYEELVSGESLLNRPAMLLLLREVEQGLYDAVLVMDIQRLGRGDLEEQGIILKTFKKSATLIITPDKTYDLNNEFDEEYSEFEAFMSRKEYKMINKRLRRGIMHSINEGNYNAPYPPFGYDIARKKTGRTLVPNREQAEIVKMIFSWYANDKIGSQIISDRLTSMGISTNRGNKWSSSSVAYIIKNPLYIGKIAWNKSQGYYSEKKKKSHKTRPSSEWLLVDGKHEPIVTYDLYQKANEIRKAHIKVPVKPEAALSNPFAGLAVCGTCGGKLRYRTYEKSDPHLICISKCGNKSSKFKYIEDAVLKGLKEMLDSYSIKIQAAEAYSKGIPEVDALNRNIISLQRELSETFRQKESLHNLLEREIYTAELFIERSNILTEKIDSIEKAISNTKEQVHKELKKISTENEVIPKIKEVLDVYHLIKTAAGKNVMLKGIIKSIEYFKTKGQRNDSFEIRINTKF